MVSSGSLWLLAPSEPKAWSNPYWQCQWGYVKLEETTKWSLSEILYWEEKEYRERCSLVVLRLPCMSKISGSISGIDHTPSVVPYTNVVILPSTITRCEPQCNASTLCECSNQVSYPPPVNTTVMCVNVTTKYVIPY